MEVNCKMRYKLPSDLIHLKVGKKNRNYIMKIFKTEKAEYDLMLDNKKKRLCVFFYRVCHVLVSAVLSP